MTLEESYPKEWDELRNKKIPQKKIDEYLLKFIARLLKEVREGKRDDMDLGDGFSIGIVWGESRGKYKLHPILHDFLIELSDYRMEIEGESAGGLENPEEVEAELKKIAKKLKIKLDI